MNRQANFFWQSRLVMALFHASAHHVPGKATSPRIAYLAGAATLAMLVGGFGSNACAQESQNSQEPQNLQTTQDAGNKPAVRESLSPQDVNASQDVNAPQVHGGTDRSGRAADSNAAYAQSDATTVSAGDTSAASSPAASETASLPQSETPMASGVTTGAESKKADAEAGEAAAPATAAASVEKNVPDVQKADRPDDIGSTASIRHEAVPAEDQTPVKAFNETPAMSAEMPSAPPSGAPAAASALPGMMQTALEKLVFSPAKAPHAAETQKIHEALAAFYTMRNFLPLWTLDGHPTPAAKAVIERLRQAPEDGLDVAVLPDLQTSTDDDAIKADLALSEAVIAYGQEATGSRVDPRTISALIGEKPEPVEPFDILASVSAAGDKAGNVLWDFNPPQKAYQQLREKLAEMRREKAPLAYQSIPSGPELTVGMRDPRVNLIRARFGLDGQQAMASEDLIYDTRVAAAVAGFQKTIGLPASGVLTARTIAALSGGQPSRLENEILANMERWRWMPRDMGETYIAVNIPDFTVAVIHDDQVLTRHRVVVGKPDTPTPVFSNKMQYLIVNPYWNVPQSIIRKEFLPKGDGDLSYLSAAGWEVSSHRGQLVVRQPPGEKNALGHIKFLFPNDYSVYLHDTPSRGLFASAKRAFSHGCVRVDQPFSFAETVLNHSWSEQRLKSLIGSNERYINLPVPLPIHIEYFTAYVDDTGRLQLRDDIYGYSHKVKMALGLEK